MADIDNLPALMERSIELQKAVKVLRLGSAANQAGLTAYTTAQSALDTLMVDILNRHMKEVKLRYDPRRPQNWEDRLAVLEVVFESKILRMPIPKLRTLDMALADKVRRTLAMANKVKVFLGNTQAGCGLLLDAVPTVGQRITVTKKNFKFVYGDPDMGTFMGCEFEITKVTEIPGQGFVCGIRSTD